MLSLAYRIVGRRQGCYLESLGVLCLRGPVRVRCISLHTRLSFAPLCGSERLGGSRDARAALGRRSSQTSESQLTDDFD